MRKFIPFFYWLILSGSALAAQTPADSLAVPGTSSNLLPALQSAVVPGWGQISQGDWPRGGLILAGEAFLLSDALYHWEEQYNRPAWDDASRRFYRDVAYGLGGWYAIGAVFSAVDALYYDRPRGRGSPTWSVFQSLLFPGWGQMANGQHWKAAGMFVLQTSLGFAAYYQHQNYLYYKRQDQDSQAGFFKSDRNRLIWWSVGALIFSAADAFVDCHLRTWDVSDDLALVPVYFPEQKAMGIGIRVQLSQFNP